MGEKMTKDEGMTKLGKRVIMIRFGMMTKRRLFTKSRTQTAFTIWCAVPNGSLQ
jgi:hypothetical protein